MAIDRYIMTLRARLPVISDDGAEMIEEVRAHLEEAAAELQRHGLHSAESERAAVQRCGPVAAVAEAIADQQRDEAMKRQGNRTPLDVLRRPAAALLLAAALTIVGGSAALAHSSPAPHQTQTPTIPYQPGGTR